MQYTLYRIEDDATTTFISEHGDLLDGIAAGEHVVEEVDHEMAYALHTDGLRVATFRGGRIGYREWARRNGRLHDEYIHALDDRYDHDVEELMVS